MDYEITLIVESASHDKNLVAGDVRKALIPLGFFPHVTSIVHRSRS